MTTQERATRIARLAQALFDRIDGQSFTVDDLVTLIDAEFLPADGRNAAGQVVEYLRANDAGQKFNLTHLDVIAVTSGGAPGWLWTGTGKITP